MKAWWVGLLTVGAFLWSSPAVADVRVTMADGHVSISATNATIRQILAEWARVGQARIVNIERVAGPPTTMEISDVSEIDVLEILLRSVGGYIIAPRSTSLPNVSRFDRIVILPVSSVPGAGITRPTMGAGMFPPPQAQPQAPPRRLDQDDADAPDPTGAAPGTSAPQRPAMFNTFPQPSRGGMPPQGQEPAAPIPPPAPSSVPTAPAGVPVPGMVLPAPQTPPAASQPR